MKIHLIGICGTGMGALAGLLKAQGHDVRGSDTDVYPPMSTQLAEQAIPVMTGFSAANLEWSPDVVVVGNVCSKDHVEVVAAQARGLRLTSFPALLEELFLHDHPAVVIAGTHGKTTTSSMASFVYTDAGLDPSFLVGGIPVNSGRSWRYGKPGGPFVIEGDEYDTAFFDKGGKFLHYRPRYAVLTSVELDHVDIFDSLDDVKLAFKKFVALIPEDGLLVVAADSPGALEVASTARCRVERYIVEKPGRPEVEAASRGTASPTGRFEGQAEWHARPLASRGVRSIFEVLHKGKPFGVFDLGLPGSYNMANALSIIAVGSSLGLSAEALSRGLRRFAGVRRRQETRGVAQGVRVIDDFAHHPTAVRETLEGLRQRFPGGRLIAVFEPRSATSRRAVFQKEYAEAFAPADEIIIGAVHLPEKAPQTDRFDPERLAADLRGKGLAARHIVDVSTIIDQIVENAGAGDTVVVMTSGGFEGIHDRLLQRLGDAVLQARATDLPGVEALLGRTQLKYPDVADHVGDLLIMRDANNVVVGCVAMELYDEAGLLRALATAPDRRGMGFGWMLADNALIRARARGCRRVFLVTENASDFFAEKLGFKRVERAMVDASVLESSQFGFDIEKATTMVRDLD